MLLFTMKKKISVSIEEKTIDDIDKFIEDGLFRNKSHVIEYAINKFMKENK